MNLKPILFLVFGLICFSCSEDKVSTEQMELMGAWELLRFENESSDELLLPSAQDAIISLVFQNNDFNGKTGRNSYFGKYSVVPSELTLMEFTITEVAETAWGQKYLDAINESYSRNTQNYLLDFSVESDTLTLYYMDSKKMTFVKV